MRRPLARALTVAYGACALAVFSLMLLVATILALLLPRLEWRRVVTRTLARLGLPLLGIRLSVHGRELLPPGSCVVVANHASYLDGVVMKAALPPRFSFVIKGEAAAMPVAGFLLKRIGSEFVERGSHAGRQRGAMRVLRRAEEGHALVFFPEGTFDEVVGLKRFHIGAFAAAVRGSMPVVPVVIRGTRRALPSGALIVRPGRVRLDILEALPVPQSPHPSEALRAAARARILARLDEPDLAPAEPPRA